MNKEVNLLNYVYKVGCIPRLHKIYTAKIGTLVDSLKEGLRQFKAIFLVLF